MTARAAAALLLALVAGVVTLAWIGHDTISITAFIACVAACVWSLIEVCR